MLTGPDLDILSLIMEINGSPKEIMNLGIFGNIKKIGKSTSFALEKQNSILQP